MKLSQRTFPHPVVGNADDVLEAAFQAAVEVSHDSVDYYLNLSVQCSSATILELVAKGEAVYVLHIECSNTLYRTVFEFAETAKEVVITGDNYLVAVRQFS